MEIVLGMRGNHSSGRGSQSLGRGRGSQQIVRGGGIQQFFSGNNNTSVLPHSPTCIEDTLASPHLDIPILSASDIPSSSHSSPAGNVSSIPPILGGTSDATTASLRQDFHNPCLACKLMIKYLFGSLSTINSMYFTKNYYLMHDYYFLFCFLMDFFL